MKKKFIFLKLFIPATILVIFFILPLERVKGEMILPELQVNIPGFEGFTKEEGLKVCLKCDDPTFLDEECPPEKCEEWAYVIPWIGEYLVAFYKWSVSAIAILAVIMVMIGGVQWIIAGGEAPKIGEAKKRITGAVSGLILVLLIYQILALIDQRLIVLEPITLAMIKRAEYEEEKPIPESIVGLTETENLKFNPNIQSQIPDASPELISLLSCLAPKIKEKTNGQKLVVTSISDKAGMKTCAENYEESRCAHDKNSCHYGGRKCRGKSYALDLGIKTIDPKITIAAIKECEPRAFICYTPETPKCKKHYTHLHVSIGLKHGCGCL